MLDLSALTDFSLLALRVMAGATFANSGYNDLKDPAERSKSIGMSRDFTVFLGAAELLGGIAIAVGYLQQLAAFGLILVMLGALQKKIFVWKTGFWGKDGMGYSYDLTLLSMLLAILATNGGAYVLRP